MAAQSNESRDYFRVLCPVLLECRSCDITQVPRVAADSFFPSSEHLNLLRELTRIEHDNAHLLPAIADVDRNLSAYLGVINRKIDTVAKHLVEQYQAQAAAVEQEVSLSEGGLSFQSGESISQGNIVALHLTLLPSYIGFAAYAEVVSCEPHQDGFRISASFRSLSEADRQILARHVMQVQLQAKRKHGGRD